VIGFDVSVMDDAIGAHNAACRKGQAPAFVTISISADRARNAFDSICFMKDTLFFLKTCQKTAGLSARG
jgi:hypothetical protein